MMKRKKKGINKEIWLRYQFFKLTIAKFGWIKQAFGKLFFKYRFSLHWINLFYSFVTVFARNMQKPIFLVWFILIELLTNATHSKNPGLKSRITSQGFTYGKRWKKVLMQTNKIIRFQYLKQFFIKLKNLIKIHVMIDVHLLKKNVHCESL